MYESQADSDNSLQRTDMSDLSSSGNFKKASALRPVPVPVGRPHSAGSKLKKKKGHGLMKLFRRERNTENGHVPIRPACFADDVYDRRSDSPEPHSPSGRPSSNSGKAFKLRRKDGRPHGRSRPFWRPKVIIY